MVKDIKDTETPAGIKEHLGAKTQTYSGHYQTEIVAYTNSPLVEQILNSKDTVREVAKGAGAALTVAAAAYLTAGLHVSPEVVMASVTSGAITSGLAGFNIRGGKGNKKDAPPTLNV